jgi:hypothetical protein
MKRASSERKAKEEKASSPLLISEDNILAFLRALTEGVSAAALCRDLGWAVRNHKRAVNRILYGLLDQNLVRKQDDDLPPLWSAVTKTVTPVQLERVSPRAPQPLTHAALVDLTSVSDIVWELQHYVDQCDVWAVGNHATNQEQYRSLPEDHADTMHFRFVQSKSKRAESVHIIGKAYELFQRNEPKLERLYLCTKKKDLHELVNVGASFGVEVIISEGWHNDLRLELEGS